MVTKWMDNERTALAQQVTRQPDGPGRRIGKRGELPGIGRVRPGGGKIFCGGLGGYKGMKDAGILELVHNAKVDAEFFYAAFPDSTRRDVEKAVRISSAVNELLDAAS